ncbi:hypothetical protein B0H10DRAFT_2210207 [Mycena sp. CBHHK59/15]|nr:hypothetical protein B0H10DRAFT_2210207 [Mycena sp. CBHHK59/15]
MIVAPILDINDAHLILAWDGDRIDRIPVPLPQERLAGHRGAILATDTIVKIVEDFLERQDFALCGLSLRIHSRDPVTETTRFAQSTLSTTSASPIMLYAVKRKNDLVLADPSPASGKREMFPNSRCIWKTLPGTRALRRRLVGLLPCFRCFTFSPFYRTKRWRAEQKVLAVAHIILRFPPAVRCLAGLLLNKVPWPKEKAALAEALFHALDEFSSRGPAAIVNNPERRFETVRILFAHIAGAGDAPSATLALQSLHPVKEISLICALSQKRMKDPVLLDSTVVERKAALLHQPGGELYHPGPSTDSSSIAELSEGKFLPQLLSQTRGLSSNTMIILRVEDIGCPLPTYSTTLDSVARDFVLAIGLDEAGLLAVFTGRGCGTTRDVNFFRPTNGGDTEVDVNDVSYALEKVIPARKMKDTWQVDSFGEVSSSSRLPDELAIIASREIIRLSLEKEDVDEEEDEQQISRMQTEYAILQLACFSSAMSDGRMKEELSQFITEMLDTSDTSMVGMEPFNVPGKLLDFK